MLEGSLRVLNPKGTHARTDVALPASIHLHRADELPQQPQHCKIRVRATTDALLHVDMQAAPLCSCGLAPLPSRHLISNTACTVHDTFR